ncbi:MAG: glycosyltransferase [Candidatus Methylomirabilales bacterium]
MIPAVSVVLPAHNAAGCIGRAVTSILRQGLADFELILVDDGSADGTAEAARAAARGDARLRLLRRPHGGIVAALNAGLAAARAPVVARMDADDEALPDRLGAQLALLRARPEIGVASCLVEFGGDPLAARGYALHVEWMNGLREPEAIALNRFIESPLAHPSAMFRRELPERHGGYAETGGPEDYELWLRWMDVGVRFAKVPRVLLRWNDPPGRLSRGDPRYRVQAFYACKCRYLARWIRRMAAGLPVLLCGAGRTTRQRFAGLEREGVPLAGFIDVDPRKVGRRVGGRPVLPVSGIPAPGTCFIIGGVGTRGEREQIRGMLAARGYGEGVDFLMAA